MTGKTKQLPPKSLKKLEKVTQTPLQKVPVPVKPKNKSRDFTAESPVDDMKNNRQ